MNTPPDIPDSILNWLQVGIVALDRQLRVTLWNRFMENHGKIPADAVLGRSLFECFDDLPRPWLEKKLKSTLVLGATHHVSWRQRPYIFRFQPGAGLAVDSDFMFQDCSIWPLRGPGRQVLGVGLSLHDVTEIAITQRLLEQATEQALTLQEATVRDGLTGVFNRAHFDERLTQELINARRHGRPLCLAMVDIDHFKRVNDNWGHQTGDAVIREVAETLMNAVDNNDSVYRYGGEEFAILIPERHQDDAAAMLETIRARIAETPICHDGETVPVTVSIGVSEGREGISPRELVRLADQALYAAKQAGRNRLISAETETA